MEVFGKERDYIVHNAEVVKGFFGDYRWLSNFHKCTIWFDGVGFPSTENAYVYAKLSDYDRSHAWETVSALMSCTPSESKKLGREIPIREDWDRIKFDVMSAVVFEKYYRHIELRHQLLATGSKLLEETNHWGDTYWGVCDGKGQNKLGKIHMRIRDYWGKEYPDLLNKKKVTKLF